MAAAFAAAIGMAALWGFTVDDAWISARVASNLARGAGYRFNSDGPVVDAVTPLGWAPLLALFAARGSTAALLAARWIGALTWLVAAAGLGVKWSRLGLRAAITGTTAIALTVPLGAWAVSGMETGLVIALGTVAL
ncbi:MAG TPA: hypothetical protein VFQ61_10090, partial [Polyangiaceae bacterium]|nr:hypothetical protein [Polyangiaceae bacterium]